ncbi:MAG TPA: hypothetical protein DCE42_15690 [Myxococcales bacterium]|nr:hypothetical protein [Deltaproteobacteria bacterium]MBU47376.1 hypothetical protein [Deltaproteobacteria bacterium]HAA56206.1 hypothetical protein [Myxococcales bacterium]
MGVFRNRINVMLMCLCLGLLWGGCPTAPQTEEKTTSEKKNEEPTTQTEQVPDASTQPETTENEPVVDKASAEPAQGEATNEPTKEPVIPDQTPTETAGQEGGKACTFNEDCASEERCECDEKTGCFCRVGTRGTGKNGVDSCKTSNDCETALCMEDSEGGYTCSGPCQTDADCESKLPTCTTIAFLGRVCIRKQP